MVQISHSHSLAFSSQLTQWLALPQVQIVTRILPELVNQGRELTEIKSQLLLLLDEEQSENLTQKIWSELNPRQGSGEETKAADVGNASEATKATDREDVSDLPNQVSSPGTEKFNITSDLEGLQRAFDDQDRERIQGFKGQLRQVAEAIAPECEKRIIGIRPGEKIHEELITSSDSNFTIDIGKFYAILAPDQKDLNKFKESFPSLKQVEKGFSYNSFNNPDYLTIDQIRGLIKKFVEPNFKPF